MGRSVEYRKYCNPKMHKRQMPEGTTLGHLPFSLGTLLFNYRNSNFINKRSDFQTFQALPHPHQWLTVVLVADAVANHIC